MTTGRRAQHPLRLVLAATLAAMLAAVGMQGAFVSAEDTSSLTCYVTVPGPAGKPGLPGTKGKTGEQGPQGEPGNDGGNGKDGLPGPKGPKGPTGPQGPPGGMVTSFGSSETVALLMTITSGKGITYQVGPLAEEHVDHVDECSPNATAIVCVGVAAPVSPNGAPGQQGDAGAPGPQGEDGKDGKNGKPGEQGPQGDPGEQGPQGDPGYLTGTYSASSAAVAVSPVVTTNAFAQVVDPWATHGCYDEGVERTGDPAPGKDGLPGQPGPQGVQGPQGQPGVDGEHGKDGLPGQPGPQGEPGPEGPKGVTLAIPVVPVIGKAVCENGEVVLPGVAITDDRTGITYGAPVVADGKVTVTATLTVDAIWSVDELPEGWSTTEDPLVIVFEGQYTEVTCETETPPTKTPPAKDDSGTTTVTSLPKTGTGSSNIDTGFVIASMAGLMIAAVAVRTKVHARS